MQFLSPVVRAAVRWLFFLVLMVSLGGVSFAWAEGTSAEAARVIMASGTVERLTGAQDWQAIKTGALLGRGDSIRTGTDGSAALLLADESIVRMNHDTLFFLQNVESRAGAGAISKVSAPAPGEGGERSLLGLLKGEIWFLNKNPREKVDIKTQAMTASLRGTEFDILVESDGTSRVSMLEGTVQVWNEYGAVTLNVNEHAIARPGFAPVKSILLNPENAVQWTVSVPELLHYEELYREQGKSPEVARLKEAWNAIGSGELMHGREVLLSLTVDFPDFAPAWESLALTALLQNDSDAALAAVEKAEQLAPGTPFPLMLRGLILQSRFDLEGAESAVRAALAVDGNNVTALIQLATLLFGQGATGDARLVMEEAQRLAPESGAVNNLQGFIYLALRNQEKAGLAFAKAVEVDPSLAEPHLGLGLIAMRQGEEELAMSEVASAVLLEPRRAMLRSYWAKMLYQLGRPGKALDVLNVSLHLDPRDPTPELYRALIYRDQRLPGAAITALNEAITKNGHRAVYRSRLLLDHDLAVKNVDLSLIYGQLGLDNWAKVKAVASLDDDYLNSSAHLFHAGSLTGPEGRSWARNTEHLLARLLMPANVNTFNTFNDYTAFFERPSLQGEYTGVAGNNDTLEQNFTVFGSLPAANLAYSGAYLPSRTQGWRDDYPERGRSAVSFVKWDPAPNHGLMFSGSRTDLAMGGKTTPRFNFYDPPESQDQQESELHRLELGYDYHPQPATHLLLHAAKIREREWIEDYTLDLKSIRGHRLEVWDRLALSQPYSQLQGELLCRMGRHQFILGSSHYRQSGESESSVSGEIDPPDWKLIMLPPLSFDYRQTLWSNYLHDIWKPVPLLTVEFALYDEAMSRSKLFSREATELHVLNPRFGIRWQPRTAHTLHLAAFRALLPFYADYLAPTGIAGVPVQRNGLPGTMSDELDLAWDYEFGELGLLSSNIFYLQRSYEEPSPEAKAVVWRTRNKGGSVVFERLLGGAAGMALSYRYDDIADDLDPALDREDHQWRGGLRWLGPRGWSAGVAQTFRLSAPRAGEMGDEKIYLTDLSLEYEFPGKRGGIKVELNNLFNHHFNWRVDSFNLGGRAPALEAMLTLKLIH